ncbi:hypothetical protein H696_03188 [Fonticula alba]|uniref:Uncharacterized protein n=1 Tax=Fonticula alba TaxID=691883 RepID=A0A058Z9N8_FONAL|nr:hypothetical protein H696_03188 [Fonticula alba]KCV70831.1 hypothetical protein H696_03188 [Fonticula alba]|eukprot:XP_009495347.1 hypothetical protein H696_03188 [Fonticula alba]
MHPHLAECINKSSELLDRCLKAITAPFDASRVGEEAASRNITFGVVRPMASEQEAVSRCCGLMLALSVLPFVVPA